MRVSDVMSARPIVVGPDTRREAVRRLMERAEVHHVPVIDGGRVAGVWLATREGPLVLLGPEHVDQTFPEADAEEAMTALIEDSEAVLVWDAGVPAGIVTASDLRRVVRHALADGAGRHAPQPVVVVVDARDAHGVPQWTLRRASAVVIARADDADPATVAAAAQALARPDRPVFVTAAGHDDRGLADWTAWLARRADGAPRQRAAENTPFDYTGAFAASGETCRPAHRGGVAGG